MTQLTLALPTPAAAPTVTGIWADLGVWMMGGPDPRVPVAPRKSREDLLRDAAIVADTHRRRVRASMGRA